MNDGWRQKDGRLPRLLIKWVRSLYRYTHPHWTLLFEHVRLEHEGSDVLSEKASVLLRHGHIIMTSVV
jgi:hypothetical protein